MFGIVESLRQNKVRAWFPEPTIRVQRPFSPRSPPIILHRGGDIEYEPATRTRRPINILQHNITVPVIQYAEITVDEKDSLKFIERIKMLAQP